MRLPLASKDILCIDWDERSLRVVEANLARSGVRIHAAVSQPVSEGTDVRDPSSMADFIRRTLGEHRLRARRVVVDVPRQDVVLNRLSLPTGTVDELAAMVHLQIGKELPFSKEQAVIDFAVVPQEGTTTCDVWVAAIRTNVIEHYRQVLTAAGLKPERIGLRPYANMVALRASGLTEGLTLMVDIGASMTEINILTEGRLAYTRAASVAVPPAGLSPPKTAGPGRPARGTGDAPAAFADDLAARPAAMENLLIEVSRTIAAYRATAPGATINRIVLAGSVGIDEHVVQVFENRFGTPTEIYQPPESMRRRGDTKTSSAPFSAVIGLALGSAGENRLHFDFLHVKEPEAERRERVKRRRVAPVAAALFLAAGAVAAYHPIRERNAELEGLRKRIAAENRDEKERKAFLDRYEGLQEWQGADVIWIDQLARLATVFPSNQKCYITEAEFTNKGTMRLDLAAVNTYVAAEVVDAVKSVTDKPASKDKEGKPVFDARVASKVDETKDPKYPVADQVYVEISSMTPDKRR